MGTNLFSQYYNNPTKSYIYSNMTCNGASADEISFDITDGNGVISDNENALATIDLSGVHVPLTQYSMDMKILNPYEIMYVRGLVKGESYMRKAYKLICRDAILSDEWMYESGITFVIKYTDKKNLRKIRFVKAVGSLSAEKTFLEVCQELFDSMKLPINVSFEDMHLVFTSTELGYEFWVSHVVLWQKAADPSTGEYDERTLDEIIDELIKNSIKDTQFSYGFYDDFLEHHENVTEDNIFNALNVYTSIISQSEYSHVYAILGIINGFTKEITKPEYDYVFDTYFLFEDFSWYIPAYKYKNGAMKGCVVVATYPIYNAENIKDYERALRLVHIKDRVEDYRTTLEYRFKNIPIYLRTIVDVVDSWNSQIEYDYYCKWCRDFDKWIEPNEVPHLSKPTCGDEHETQNSWIDSETPDNYELTSLYKDYMHHDYMGLYGFCNYATKHDMWMTFGDFYARTTVDDDESTNSRNLIPSFIIYNPNSFPVTIKYMTFV